jgi:hypothetical protein
MGRRFLGMLPLDRYRVLVLGMRASVISLLYRFHIWQVFLTTADISSEDRLVMCSFISSISIVFLTVPLIHPSDIFFRQVLLFPRSYAVLNCFLSWGIDVFLRTDVTVLFPSRPVRHFHDESQCVIITSCVSLGKLNV